MSQVNKLNPMHFCRVPQTEMTLLADIWPLIQVLISALRMARGQVAQKNFFFENKTRKDPSNSVKIDPHSCASLLNTLLQNLCESNIFSMWNTTLNFPKFLLLVEMDGMKEGNEDNGCAPSPSYPWKAPSTLQVSTMAPALRHWDSYSKGWRRQHGLKSLAASSS